MEANGRNAQVTVSRAITPCCRRLITTRLPRWLAASRAYWRLVNDVTWRHKSLSRVCTLRRRRRVVNLMSCQRQARQPHTSLWRIKTALHGQTWRADAMARQVCPCSAVLSDRLLTITVDTLSSSPSSVYSPISVRKEIWNMACSCQIGKSPTQLAARDNRQGTNIISYSN